MDKNSTIVVLDSDSDDGESTSTGKPFLGSCSSIRTSPGQNHVANQTASVNFKNMGTASFLLSNKVDSEKHVKLQKKTSEEKRATPVTLVLNKAGFIKAVPLLQGTSFGTLLNIGGTPITCTTPLSIGATPIVCSTPLSGVTTLATSHAQTRTLQSPRVQTFTLPSPHAQTVTSKSSHTQRQTVILQNPHAQTVTSQKPHLQAVISKKPLMSKTATSQPQFLIFQDKNQVLGKTHLAKKHDACIDLTDSETKGVNTSQPNKTDLGSQFLIIGDKNQALAKTRLAQTCDTSIDLTDTETKVINVSQPRVDPDSGIEQDKTVGTESSKTHNTKSQTAHVAQTSAEAMPKIKLRDINTILQKPSDVQEKLQTLEQTPNSSETAIQSSSFSDKEKLVSKIPEHLKKSTIIQQIPKFLAPVIQSLPSLPQDKSNMFVINFPNKTSIMFNPNKPYIFVDTDVKRNIDKVQIPHSQDFQQRASTSEASNIGKVETSAVVKTKQKPPKVKVEHPCLDLRKRMYKVDLEGFTFFDRLGFYKAEEKRAKRCLMLSNLQLKVRRDTVTNISQEYKQHSQQNEIPLKDRMEQLVEKCKNESSHSTSTATTPLPKENDTIKNKRKRQRLNGNGIVRKRKRLTTKAEFNGVPNTSTVIIPTTQRPKRNCVVKKRIRRQKSGSHNETTVAGPNGIIREKGEQSESKNYKGYNLKEAQIVLDRQEVEEYLSKNEPKTRRRKKRQKPRNLKRMNWAVSKQKLPKLYDKYTTLADLVPHISSSATFVDETFLDLLEAGQLGEGPLYFVNKRSVATFLYMEFFPWFLQAVQTGTLKVVDKSVFKDYTTFYNSYDGKDVKVFCSSDEDTVKREENHINAKASTFCNFVKAFHSKQKFSRKQTKHIVSEHSYSFVNTS